MFEDWDEVDLKERSRNSMKRRVSVRLTVLISFRLLSSSFLVLDGERGPVRCMRKRLGDVEGQEEREEHPRKEKKLRFVHFRI